MKVVLVQSEKRVEINPSTIKRIFATSQSNISVLKTTGETLTGSLIEFV